MKDLEAVYDEQVSPLMTKIIGICKEHGMPMLASFQYKNEDRHDGDGFRYCTTFLPLPECSDVLKRAGAVMRGEGGGSVLAMTIVSEVPRKADKA